MTHIYKTPGVKDLLSFAYSAFRGVSPSGSGALRHYGETIDRRTRLTYAEFLHNYLIPLQPVLIRGAMDKWKALHRWSPEFFKKEFSNMSFTIGDTEYGQDGYGSNPGISLTMPELMERILNSTAESPAPYFRRKDLGNLFPSLLTDIEPLPEYFRPNWLSDRYFVKKVSNVLNPAAEIYLYIGGAGAVFPVLHYDGAGTHAFLLQVYGRKEYVLFPPDQEPYLYPSPRKSNLSLIDNVENPDLNKFPLFAKARPITLILEPGEILFIPCHWWHTVRMLTPSITISTNLLNQSNWHELVRFVASGQRSAFRSVASRAYLTVAGMRRYWRDGDGFRTGKDTNASIV